MEVAQRDPRREACPSQLTSAFAERQRVPRKGEMISLAGFLSRFLKKTSSKTQTQRVVGQKLSSSCSQPVERYSSGFSKRRTVVHDHRTDIDPVQKVSGVAGFRLINETKIIQASQK